MTKSRPHFSENLYVALDIRQDPKAEYEKCRSRSLRMISEGQFNRIFSDYPAMLTRYDYFRLRNRMLDILRHIPHQDIEPDFNLVGNEWIKKEIDSLIIEIARVAAGELLDKDGKCGDELFVFLKLDKDAELPKFEGKEFEVIRSYVCDTLQAVIRMAKSYKPDLWGPAFHAFSKHMQDSSNPERFAALIQQGMDAPDRDHSFYKGTAERNLKFYLPLEHPDDPTVIASAVAAGTTIVAAAATVGILLFKAFTGSDGPAPNPGPSMRP